MSWLLAYTIICSLVMAVFSAVKHPREGDDE
jgi:hypothetical protein